MAEGRIGEVGKTLESHSIGPSLWCKRTLKKLQISSRQFLHTLEDSGYRAKPILDFPYDDDNL